MPPAGRVPTGSSHQVSTQVWAQAWAKSGYISTPHGESANQGQPPSVGSSVSNKSGYTSGWHNGLMSCTMARRPLGECQLRPATKCQLKRELRAATRPSQQCHPPGAARRIAQLSYYELTGCATATRWARGQRCAQMGRITWNAR